MDLFLWVLQAGGLSIAVVGMGRERWLRMRRLSGLTPRGPLGAGR